MSISMSPTGTGTCAPAYRSISSGVSPTAAKVEQAVISTESGRFPPARWVMTFEAVPPGQQATRIRPTAIGGERPIHPATAQPASGMMTNWAAMPSSAIHGVLSASRKSAKRRVNPMPSMMMPSPRGMWERNHVKCPGASHAHVRPMASQSAKALLMRANMGDSRSLSPILSRCEARVEQRKQLRRSR